MKERKEKKKNIENECENGGIMTLFLVGYVEERLWWPIQSST